MNQYKAVEWTERAFTLSLSIFYVYYYRDWVDTPRWWIPPIGLMVAVFSLKVLRDMAHERIAVTNNDTFWPSHTVTTTTGIHPNTLKKWAADGLIASTQRGRLAAPFYNADDVFLTVAEKIMTGQYQKQLWCKMPIAALERAAEKLHLSLVDPAVKQNLTRCLPFNTTEEHDK